MSDTPAPHSHRLTFVVAAAGVLIASYALWRGDRVADRQNAANDRVQRLETVGTALRADLNAGLEREARARAALEKQYAEVAALPQQVKDLAASHEDLRARTERPQRAWSRAEALYLIDLAQRRLNFDHDVGTAIVALEAADSRLASLRDASLQPIREKLATDIQALRAVPEVDRVGIMARIAALETQAASLPLKGVLAGQRVDEVEVDTSSSVFARSWSYLKQAVHSMFTVHRLSDDANRVVSIEEQTVRREHLTLLAFSARLAVLRSDQPAYQAALFDLQNSLSQNFEKSAAVDAAKAEITALLATNVAPPLPRITSSSQLLLRSGTTSP